MRNYFNLLLLIFICSSLQNCQKQNIEEETEQFIIGQRSNEENEANQVVIRYNEDYTDDIKEILRNKYSTELDFDINYIEYSQWDNRLEIWKVSKADSDTDIDVNDLVTNMKTKDFDEGDLEESGNILIAQGANKGPFVTSQNSNMNEHIIQGDGPIIAIIDSGLDYGEINGDYLYNTTSDNTDEISGWDFVNDDFDIRDDFGHGTHIAKTIIEEVKPYYIFPRFVPIKAFDENGQTNLFRLLQALSFVNANEEIDAVNMSLGWIDQTKSLILEEMINEVAENTLIICSSGNDGLNTDPDKITHYPSGLSNSQILSVGGFSVLDGEPTTSGDNVSGIESAEWSNFGKKKVDLYAPFDGYDIHYSYLNDPIKTSGTSFAAAFATSRAVLLYEPGINHKAWKQNIILSGFNSFALKGYCQSTCAIIRNEIN